MMLTEQARSKNGEPEAQIGREVLRLLAAKMDVLVLLTKRNQHCQGLNAVIH